MKLYKYTLAALLSACLLTACSNEEEQLPGKTNNAPLRFEVYDAGMSGGTRAVTNDQYVTTFGEGDEIGLYAVKSGAIVEGISNICLTYNEGAWSFPSAIEYSDALEGVTYYAYYPYNESASFNASAEDPFASLVAGWTIASDLSDADTYSQNDLMTTSATGQLANGTYTISLGMVHRMGMISVKLPLTVYQFTNNGMADYTVGSAAESFTLSLNSEAAADVTPYYKSTSGIYRMLVKPATPCVLTGSYGGKNFKISLASGVTAGTYEPYTVDGGAQVVKTFTLAVGDYFCADGSLVSGSEAAPSNAIGVVYNIGTTDAIKADYPGASHALVYSIKRVEGDAQYWGAGAPGTSPAFSSWWTDEGLKTDKTTVHGYEDTKIWKSLGLIDGKNVNMYVKAALTGYTVVLPEGTTGWYVPSYFESTQIAAKAATLNASFAAANGEQLWDGADTTIGYWTSTMRSRYSIYMYVSTGISDSGVNMGASAKGYYRFSFAF